MAGWTAALLAIVLGRLVSHGDWHSISLDVQDLRTACTAQVQQALGHQFALIPREARQGKAHLDFMHAQADQLLERAGSGGGALVDLCFIDGDHSFQAVQRDYLSIKERCRVLVFHDIVAPEVPGVAKLWQMLKLSSEEEGMQWHEFLQQPAGSSLHFDAHGQRHGYLGIGILVRHGKRHSSGPVSQDAGLRAYLSQTYREHTPLAASTTGGAARVGLRARGAQHHKPPLSRAVREVVGGWGQRAAADAGRRMCGRRAAECCAALQASYSRRSFLFPLRLLCTAQHPACLF